MLLVWWAAFVYGRAKKADGASTPEWTRYAEDAAKKCLDAHGGVKQDAKDAIAAVGFTDTTYMDAITDYIDAL